MSHLGQRLSAFIDGELSHHRRERVLAHLAHCEPCRREAAALRMLKQRMHALGAATADTALTDRLIAVAGVAGPGLWRRRPPLAGRRSLPGFPRRRWLVRSVLAAGLTLAGVGLGVPAAAFLAGAGQQEPGPSVTPAIDMFMVQHEISAGGAPAMPPPSAPAGPGTAAAAAPTVPSELAVLTAAGAAAASARVAALTRLTAASARAAASPGWAAAAAGRVTRARPAITTGAR
jgi:Putative zinc-finger